MQVSAPLILDRPHCICRRCEPGFPDCGGFAHVEVLITADVQATDDAWLPLSGVDVSDGFRWGDLNPEEQQEAEERLRVAYQREVEKLRRDFPFALERARRALSVYVRRGETGAVDQLLEELQEFSRKVEV